jgi:UDP-2-acetamido-2-deoxy-ribo-hexuluronate aminotransferase
LGAETTEEHKGEFNGAMAEIVPPYIESRNTSVYAQYTIQVNNRESLQGKLKLESIPTAVHYPVPLNKQPALSTNEFDLKVSEKLSAKVMSLPMHPYLEREDQASLVKILVTEKAC